MGLLTLGQAARLAGVGKTTLTRAIKAGRLSATRRDDGGYLIDPAELCRVYPPGATPETVTATGDAVHRATPPATPATPPRDSETVARLASLEAEVRGLRELLAEVRAGREKAEASLEAEREHLRLFMAALPKPVDTAPQDARQPASGGRWWPFGRRVVSR